MQADAVIVFLELAGAFAVVDIVTLIIGAVGEQLVDLQHQRNVQRRALHQLGAGIFIAEPLVALLQQRTHHAGVLGDAVLLKDAHGVVVGDLRVGQPPGLKGKAGFETIQRPVNVSGHLQLVFPPHGQNFIVGFHLSFAPFHEMI